MKNSIEELENCLEEVAKSNKTKIRIIKGLLVTAVILGAAAAGTQSLYSRHVRHMYESTLAVYADTNRDNVISYLEEATFKSNLLEGKNAVFVGDSPIYKTGEHVHSDTYEEWIRDYNPSK